LDVDENQKPDGWDITEDLANNITIWSQPLEKLKRNTLYTLSFVSQDKPTTGLAVSLIGCSITSFDNSYPLQGYGTDQREIPNLTDERQYSGRFLVGDNAACTLQLSASQNIPNLFLIHISIIFPFLPTLNILVSPIFSSIPSASCTWEQSRISGLKRSIALLTPSEPGTILVNFSISVRC